MDFGTLGTGAAGLLIAISGFIGVMAKRASDRQAARDAAAKAVADREAESRRAAAELEAKRAQEVYDQMQEDLAATRTEVRLLQEDLGKSRTEMTRQQEDMQQLWSRFSALRREFDAAQAHIADVHRWDEGGRLGPIPTRPAMS